MPTEAIISIKPVYAEAILTKKKRVELRRRIPETKVGTRLWIYATKPVGSVVGYARVAAVSKGPPHDIWTEFKDQVGVTRDQFVAYYAGAREAVALLLEGIHRCEPVGIDELRQLGGGFHPPQVLARLTTDLATKLRAASGVA